MNNYLNSEVLNDIETKVFNLHNKFASKFNIVETNLKNIEVGDDLSNKVLYLNFPHNLYKEILDFSRFLIVDEKTYVAEEYLETIYTSVCVEYKNLTFYNYMRRDYTDVPKLDYYLNEIYCNFSSYKLPKDFGIITEIDNNAKSYKYIRIKNRPDVPLSYEKKGWTYKDIFYMQDIQMIEDGINEIADMWFIPPGFEKKTWLSQGNIHSDINTDNNGLSCKSISINDINRINKNVELLESSFDDSFNIWNFQSFLNYDEESGLEWDDYNYKVQSVAVTEDNNYLITEEGDNLIFEEVFING